MSSFKSSLVVSAKFGAEPILAYTGETENFNAGICALAKDVGDFKDYPSHYVIDALKLWWEERFSQSKSVYESAPEDIFKFILKLNTNLQEISPYSAVELVIILFWNNQVYVIQFGGGEVYFISRDLQIKKMTNRPEGLNKAYSLALGSIENERIEETLQLLPNAQGSDMFGRFIILDSSLGNKLNEKDLKHTITKEANEAVADLLEAAYSKGTRREHSLIVSDRFEVLP